MDSQKLLNKEHNSEELSREIMFASPLTYV
jgi:hypothetical protein